MTPNELFNSLKKVDFSFTKHPEYDKQKESMDKLIACGLAEKIGQNKYSLTTDGKKASIIGLEKWSKNLTDINRRELIYDCFGFLIIGITFQD